MTYKLEVAAQVNTARERFHSGTAGWEDLLRRAFTGKLNNLTNWQNHDSFLKWMGADCRLPTRTGAGGRCMPCGRPTDGRKNACKTFATKSLRTFSGRLARV